MAPKIENARLKDFVRIDTYIDGRFYRDHLLCLAEDAQANAARVRSGLPPGFRRGSVVTTTISYPIGLKPVKEGGVGLVVDWSTVRPEQPYDFPLKGIWMVYLMMKKGSEYPNEVIFAPSVVIKTTVAELAVTRQDLYWIPGADAPMRITSIGVGFDVAREDCEWCCPELAAENAIRQAGDEMLLRVGITERSAPRYGRCNKCHKLSKASGRRLKNRPLWTAAENEHICACP